MVPRDAEVPEPGNHLPEPASSPSLPPNLAPVQGPVVESSSFLWKAGLPAMTPPPAQGMDAVGVFKALRRRWMLALAVAPVVAAAAGVAAWFLLGPKAVAFARIRVLPSTTAGGVVEKDSSDNRSEATGFF